MLRYPSIDYRMRIPETFRWLVLFEHLVDEARARQCTKLRDKIVAPLTFALNGMFTLKETESFHIVAQDAQAMLVCSRLIFCRLLFSQYNHVLE